MRILNVTQSYHPFQSRGGPAFKVRSISRALIKRGHRVSVLTADLGFTPCQEQAAAAVYEREGWRSSMDGVDSLYLNTRGRYRALTFNPGVLSFCRRRLPEFDLVHIYGLYDLLGPAVAHSCRMLGIPYFVEPLGMTVPIDRGFALKRAWLRLARNYLRGANKLITTSELERQELLDCGFPAKDVMLRYNGVDGEEFSALPSASLFRKRIGVSPQQRLVLFLGRLIPRKGADLLIEAMPNICEEAILVIAGPEGEAGYLSWLRARAHAAGVEHRVKFPGPLYEQDKKRALVAADIFVLPSRYENFGNAAAEAIACGTPAIVSDRCGIAPLIDQRAGLITDYDTAAIARAINALIKNATLYKQLKAGCSVVTAELSWDTLVEQLQTAYEASLTSLPVLASAA